MFSQYLHIVNKYIVLCLVLLVREAKSNFFKPNRYITKTEHGSVLLLRIEEVRPNPAQVARLAPAWGWRDACTF